MTVDRLGKCSIDSVDFIDFDCWVWQSTKELLLNMSLAQLFEHLRNIFESYHLSSSLTTDKVLHTEQ